ncbi:MAG: efflux RND transporter periplasmic adaptor subunit [Sedimentisphaerales bacterium]
MDKSRIKKQNVWRVVKPSVNLLMVGLFGIVVGAFLFWGLRPAQTSGEPNSPFSRTSTQIQPEKEIDFWTCSMHPQIHESKPGLCPICKMPLIPVYKESGDEMADPRQFTTSESAKALMNIETAPVERRFATAEIRMVGKIDYDETRVEYITAWVAGRLDRLYVDYTGVSVRKGDHMVYIYSPELLSAQEELLQAIKAQDNIKNSQSQIIRDVTSGTVDAAREKLKLLGLTPEQISEIEKRGTPSDHMTIYSPSSGIVIHKNAQEGMYVTTGTRIYTVADLSNVWVKLDAYESDLSWLRYGQEVEFTTVSYPGEVFKGIISFIDPVLNSTTRTVKVRVDVPNKDGRLKPEMFVKAIVKANVASGGKVMDAKLAGKWICPMHPSVIKDEPGNCDICGMPLVKTESLGYVIDDPAGSEKPLVIPATAPLITGTRAIVYVEVPDANKPTFEGREVILGPRAGNFYIVKDGLKEGERVVTRGNFKIDSALQIQAKPSMMSPENANDSSGVQNSDMDINQMSEAKEPVNPEFLSQLEKVFAGYFDVQKALASDEFENAGAGISETKDALAKVDMELLSGNNHMLWMQHVGALNQILANASNANDIEELRKQFALLSEQMFALGKAFGSPDNSPLYQLKCPMAFNNRGATWLQQTEDTHNPYFGAAMPECGSVIDTISQSK